MFFVDKLWLVYGVVKESPLSQIKRNAIAIIASIDDNLFNHLLQNLLSFIELNMENNIDKKVLSYQKELEAEKKGQTYTVLLNINAKKLGNILS